jgi:3-oxoadipyl-CoA thiolase
MGETAEILARQHGITREQSDAFALDSQRKAKTATDAGHFATEIAPVTLPAVGRGSGGDTVVERDEHPRGDTTIESLGRLPTVFGEVEGHPGIITAGTSSGITDGGAALILASADAARARGLKPRARILGWASAGVDPRLMGIGPVPAIQKLTDRTGIGLDDFDLVELNEAFAAQVLACCAKRRFRPIGSTSTAAPSRSGTRSAPPARAWSSRCCTSSSGAARHAAWRRCV